MNATVSATACTCPPGVVVDDDDDSTMSYHYLWIPQTILSIFSWISNMFLLERLDRSQRPTRAETVGLALYGLRTVMYWICSVATKRHGFALQIASSLVGSAASWAAFYVILRNKFDVPSTQQWSSFTVTILSSLMWGR